jgi:carboxymethylenebutenolidase
MKKVTVFIITLFVISSAIAQDITLCHTPATEKFAMLASNKNFNASHPKPRVYKHYSEVGEMISFATPDGNKGAGYFLKAKQKSNKWILVFQEWWGLNDNIKRQAEDLYKDLGNVNVLALDLYDGKIASTREVASQYMQSFKQERGTAIVKGVISYAGKDAVFGTVGWCFGGGQSFQAALTAGKQAIACVVYYGMPEEDPAKLKNLNADVLGIFGTKDKWINPDVVKKFEANMKAVGKPVTIKNYDADHGFANPSNPMGAFDEAAHKDAYQQTLNFFRKHFH